MDKSNSSPEGAVDPVTGKTEPTKPAREPVRDATGPVGGEAGNPVTSPEVSHAAPLVEDNAPAPQPPRHDVPGAQPIYARWDGAQAKSVAVRATKVAAIVFSAWFAVVLVLIVVLRFVNPPFSTLMMLRWLGGTSISRQWVPLERISPHLIRTVIVSEDGRFCKHWGIDLGAIREAIERARGGTPRGASTITMQVAKNLFLWPSKSYVRKAIELPLTFAIELAWPKRRILEVYLNIAEWGPGVFGAEAAARAHFNRSAMRLSAHQSARLAVALPNPVARSASNPGPWTARRASRIRVRAARSRSTASCIYPPGG